MSLEYEGRQLLPAEVRALMLLGGDTSVSISDTAEASPSSRNLHMMTRYMAPLNKYWQDWHGRALHAVDEHIKFRRTDLHTQAVNVDMAMSEATNDVISAWDYASITIDVLNNQVGSTALPDADRRFRVHHNASQVAVASIAAKFGADVHKVAFSDVHALADKVLQLFAAQGATSVELLSSAVDYSGQVVAAKQAQRDYLEQSARFESSKYLASQELKAKRRSGVGNLVSTLLGAAGQMMGGK